MNTFIWSKEFVRAVSSVLTWGSNLPSNRGWFELANFCGRQSALRRHLLHRHMWGSRGVAPGKILRFCSFWGSESNTEYKISRDHNHVKIVSLCLNLTVASNDSRVRHTELLRFVNFRMADPLCRHTSVLYQFIWTLITWPAAGEKFGNIRFQ